MDNQSILRSNFLILYSNLETAINDYLKYGHTNGQTQFIDAYLSATIHALIDYADKYLDIRNEKIKACRYANNTLKHNESLISHKEITGGFSFPISFPLCIEKIEVVWNYDGSVKVHHEDQQNAFKKHFAGKPILETLQPIVLLIKGEEQ